MFASAKVRITSYNVCYTKLLRKKQGDNNNLNKKTIKVTNCNFLFDITHQKSPPAKLHFLKKHKYFVENHYW